MKTNLRTGNPEALHDISQSTEKLVGDTFVNPGTPDQALVNRNQMAQATIKGQGADVMKANLIK